MDSILNKRVMLILLAGIICLSIGIWHHRLLILKKIGAVLLIDQAPVKSDIIVVLRGPESSFIRLLEANRLYQAGFGNKIYIPLSLADNNCNQMDKMGIRIDCGRHRIEKILYQLGVEEKDIITDEQQPGGGTLCEALRAKKMIEKYKAKSLIVVTSWWHTKRVSMIYKNVFSDTQCKIYVVSAKNDLSSKDNWWGYRYEAIHVLQEYIKLLIFKLNSVLKLSFKDDPSLSN